MNVDVMQATNYPRVSNDEGYGSIVAGLQGPRGRDAQRDYEAAMATIRQPTPRQAAPATPRPPARLRTPAPTAAAARRRQRRRRHPWRQPSRQPPQPSPTGRREGLASSCRATSGRPTPATSTQAKAGPPPWYLRRRTPASSALTSRVHPTAPPSSRSAWPQRRCCCFYEWPPNAQLLVHGMGWEEGRTDCASQAQSEPPHP
jgi:hypothetical protein